MWNLTHALIACLLASGCTTTKAICNLETNTCIVENQNLLRVQQSSQVVTYDPQTEILSIAQVLVADAMSPEMLAAWSKLMEVAAFALTGTVIASTAGLPTTPAALAGGIVGYAKQRLTEPEEEQVPVPTGMTVDEALRILGEGR